MSRRKSAVSITGAELAKSEHREQQRRDRASTATGLEAGLMSPLAARRAARGQIEARDLLNLARSAARLELRGAMYSPDDRQDVAASIVAAVLADTGGALPRGESERVKLGRLCGDAKNYRRSIDARRERDRIDAEARALDAAHSADALGIGSTPAEHVAILARSGERAACLAASAVCRTLELTAAPDGPVWSLFYVWARGLSPEVCAAERGATWGAFRVRLSRGAALVRGAYGLAELAGQLTLGATVTDDGLVYVLRDESSEAHGRTRCLADVHAAPHWREGTDAGTRAERPRDAHAARAACTVSRMPARERVHWRRRRANLAAHEQATADALAKLGRAYASDARRERTAARDSALSPIS